MSPLAERRRMKERAEVGVEAWRQKVFDAGFV